MKVVAWVRLGGTEGPPRAWGSPYVPPALYWQCWQLGRTAAPEREWCTEGIAQPWSLSSKGSTWRIVWLGLIHKCHWRGT